MFYLNSAAVISYGEMNSHTSPALQDLSLQSYVFSDFFVSILQNSKFLHHPCGGRFSPLFPQDVDNGLAAPASNCLWLKNKGKYEFGSSSCCSDVLGSDCNEIKTVSLTWCESWAAYWRPSISADFWLALGDGRIDRWIYSCIASQIDMAGKKNPNNSKTTDCDHCLKKTPNQQQKLLHIS